MTPSSQRRVPFPATEAARTGNGGEAAGGGKARIWLLKDGSAIRRDAGRRGAGTFQCGAAVQDVMEAKRTVAIIVGIAAALTLTGRGAGSDRLATAPAATALVIRARNNVAGTAVLTLRCDPPVGTLPDAAAACARLSHAPGVLLHPRALRCPGGPLSPWDLHIRGRTSDRRIHVDIATCLTPQIRLIRLLGITTNQLLQVIDTDH